MSTAPQIEIANIDSLFLDPLNPRLGRHEVEKKHSQDKLLYLMQDWSLNELAVSFIESGYWPQEALIVTKEKIPDQPAPVMVVIEGNRRLAALKMLRKALLGEEVSNSWHDLIANSDKSIISNLFNIPYIVMPDRKSVQSYLGFRHVTGIKEWSPAEKAQFIAHMIEDENLTYDQVRKRIGSKTPTVKQHYVAYRLLLQMEEYTDDIDTMKVEDRFSVLYRSVRTSGIQNYLGLNLDLSPKDVLVPVAADKSNELIKLTAWLFGSKKRLPVLGDSRNLDDFGRILLSPTGLSYLENTDNPNFETAKRAAGVSQQEIAENIELACYKIEETLSVIHQFKSDATPRLLNSIKRIGKDTSQLLSIFPNVNESLKLEAT